MKKYFLFLVIPISSCTNCGTPTEECPAWLTFRLPSKIYPDKHDYNLGDTIWMESAFPKTLMDSKGDIMNDFTGYDFLLTRSFQHIDTAALYNDANPFFEFQQILGTTAAFGHTFGQDHVIGFEERGDSIFHKVAYIPKKRGVFLTLVSTFGRETDRRSVPACRFSRVHVYMKVNDEAENGYSLLKYNQDTLDKWDKLTKVEFDSLGYFVFRVN